LHCFRSVALFFPTLDFVDDDDHFKQKILPSNIANKLARVRASSNVLRIDRIYMQSQLIFNLPQRMQIGFNTRLGLTDCEFAQICTVHGL
jgi:hypothetical protein